MSDSKDMKLSVKLALIFVTLVLTSSMIWPFTMGFSSTFQIVQILVHSTFDLVSSILAVEATEPISEPVTQMALEPINNHLILVQQKR